MDNIDFPFQYDVFPEFGRMFVPIAKIGLNTINGLVHYNFIVDTGADFTTLPHHMAIRLRIDLKKAKRSIAEGIGGHKIHTWLSEIELVLSEKTTIKVPVSITNENSTPFLLGRAGLLDVLCSWHFDAKDKNIKFVSL